MGAAGRRGRSARCRSPARSRRRASAARRARAGRGCPPPPSAGKVGSQAPGAIDLDRGDRMPGRELDARRVESCGQARGPPRERVRRRFPLPCDTAYWCPPVVARSNADRASDQVAPVNGSGQDPNVIRRTALNQSRVSRRTRRRSPSSATPFCSTEIVSVSRSSSEPSPGSSVSSTRRWRSTEARMGLRAGRSRARAPRSRRCSVPSVRWAAGGAGDRVADDLRVGEAVDREVRARGDERDDAAEHRRGALRRTQLQHDLVSRRARARPTAGSPAAARCRRRARTRSAPRCRADRRRGRARPTARRSARARSRAGRPRRVPAADASPLPRSRTLSTRRPCSTRHRHLERARRRRRSACTTTFVHASVSAIFMSAARAGSTPSSSVRPASA